MKSFNAILFILFLSFKSYGQNSLYLHSVNDAKLHLVNLDNCSSVVVGDMPETMYDIAMSPDGQLYAISSTSRLYSIDKSTGNGVLIKNCPPNLNALVYGPDNFLYACSSRGDLYKINPKDGNEVNLGNCTFFSGGDLTFYEGKLYLSGLLGDLIEVNIQQPSKSKSIGQMNASSIYGIITVGATTCSGEKPKVYATGNNMLYEVDMTNANIKQKCTLNIFSIGGAASITEASKIVKKNAGKDLSTSICYNSSSTLNLSALLVDNDKGGTWKDIDNSNALNNDILNPKNLKSGIYHFQYTVGENLCSDIAIVTVEIKQPVKLDNINVKNTRCDYPSGEIEVQVANNTVGLSFSIDDIVYQNNNVFKNLNAGNYTVLVKEQNGCTNAQNITIQPNSTLKITNIDIKPATCGKDNGILTIGTSGGIGTIDFSYNNAISSKNNTFENLKAGNYIINVMDSEGCADTKSTIIEFIESLKIIQIIPNITSCGIADGRIVVNATGKRLPLSYSIDNNVFNSSPEFKNLSPGKYEVTIKDADDCVVTQKVEINSNCENRVYLPTAFSPNEDGINETLNIYFTNKFITIRQFVVYNRWGLPIYAHGKNSIVKNNDVLWDGRVNNNIVEQGTYAYVIDIEFDDGRTYSNTDSFIIIK